MADILGELSSAQWQNDSPLHLGLEALAKTVRTAAHALDDYLIELEAKGVITQSEYMGTPTADRNQVSEEAI